MSNHRATSAKRVRRRTEEPGRPTTSEEQVEGLGNVDLIDGEVVFGAVDLMNVSGLLGMLECQLLVTNYRIVYRAEAKNIFNQSHVLYDAALSDIHGFVGSSSNGLGRTAVTILAIALPIAALSIVVGGSLAAYVTLGILALLFVGSKRSWVTLRVVPRHAGAPVTLMNPYGALAAENPTSSVLSFIAAAPARVFALLGVFDARAPVGDEGISQRIAAANALVNDARGRATLQAFLNRRGVNAGGEPSVVVSGESPAELENRR